MFFLACIVVLAFGSVAMVGIGYVLYLLGRALARVRPHQIHPVMGTGLVAVAWLPVAALALLVPIGPIMQVGIAVCFYALFAQPTCVGYWAGRAIERMQSEARWNKNSDDWLAEWECQEYVE